MTNLSQTALGAWSGGRFMKFGEPIDEDRFTKLMRPDADIPTVITADVYGAGQADLAVGSALSGLPRDSYNLVGAVGHDFVKGERRGAKGFPRFTDPALRGPEGYAEYLRESVESSLERCGTDRFDLLLLHNPDRVGFTSEAVWEALAAIRDEGLADSLGVAPGPANGFVLDLLACLELFGELVDWAMLILNPLEPWPAELGLPACADNGTKVIARVVDHGGIFHGDVKPGHQFREHDHRGFRPAGWVEAGNAKLDQMRPIADELGLSTLQLACAWNLAHPAVECVAPTLIQEAAAGCKTIEAQRADLAELPNDAGGMLSPEQVETIRSIGDNRGCMQLKGGSPDHEGDEQPDRWMLDDRLVAAGERWGVTPADFAAA